MGWKSYHVFYHDEDKMDELLCFLKEHFLDKVIRKRYFFFIRYWKGGPHLRLRIKELSDEEEKTFYHVVNHFFYKNPSEVTLNKIEFYHRYQMLLDKETKYMEWFANHSIHQIDYIPELRRYNGPKVMALSEEQFTYSSMYILEILQRRNIKSYKDRYKFGLQSIIYMVRSMKLSLQKQIDFLRSYCIGTITAYLPNQIDAVLFKFSNFYKENESVYRSFLKNSWMNDHPSFYKQYLLFSKEIKNHYDQGDFIYNNIKIQSIEDWHPKETAVGQTYWSWIHMHSNRLGISPMTEAEIAFQLSHALDSVRRENNEIAVN
ncbi:lantibiotic dehydratase C-terminal domain-containing protein [Desmospora activa]|uniref:Thiopeptide-type bacteriocin biosynthesis protein n=1 Tax=Desmospora activa DSM 45169 TaxID=1121389 RepID=A0A2T4Z7Z0_9BACL|nr:lantibiotic dehydratase C-terminal domain-containing protein [Desmospora activa]PTM57989.1 thiopeptide-type bacteriocin biosynthesis protein [Desmospora activa DSM 45169]